MIGVIGTVINSWLGVEMQNITQFGKQFGIFK